MNLFKVRSGIRVNLKNHIDVKTNERRFILSDITRHILDLIAKKKIN